MTEQEARADERRKCIEEALEVASAMREKSAWPEAWAAATVANYLNKAPPFGFIGPPWPGRKISQT